MNVYREHALLSASSAKRWMACPPSARLEDELPESTSKYADEGTLAHRIGEILLRNYIEELDNSDAEIEMRECALDEHYSENMDQLVTNEYVNLCIERYNERLAADPSAIMVVEQRLDYSSLAPEGFGTGDCVIVGGGLIDITDLKYGQGVPVSAVNNPQLRLYAIGALDAYDLIYDIERVRMTIVQPRLNSVTTEELSVEELRQWAEQEVRPSAELAFKGEGEFHAGDHCQFCKVKYNCRARAEANLELVKKEFSAYDPDFLTVDEIAEVLDRADEFVKWINDVKEFALKEAQAGTEIPGYKLVEGRTKRVYSDKGEVESLLSVLYDPDTYAPRELLPITKLEDAIGKKTFAEVLSGLVVKSAGAATLVSVSDPRPAIGSADSAKADFTAYDEED